MRPLRESSAAFELCALVWKESQETTRFAWLRLNQSMRRALQLAISSGMRFHPDDFVRIVSEFRGGHWLGAEHESLYATACKAGNLSACRAYERWRERKPLMFEGRRMFVGREVRWQGMKAHCTSIHKDYFIAVVPKGWEDGEAKHFNRKPEKILRIDRQQLREARDSDQKVAKAA